MSQLNVLRSSVLLGSMFYLLIATTSYGNPIKSGSDKKMEKAMMYLTRFGYMAPESDSSSSSSNSIMASSSSYGWKPSFTVQQNPSQEVLSKAIKVFQRFAGLDQTGVIDAKTEEMMSVPRCGVKDVFVGTRRSKRFDVHSSKWPNRNLTYEVNSYPTNRSLTKSEVESDIAAAFSLWSSVTDLTFTQKSRKPVDIDLHFEKGDHGDTEPFNGTGHVLAHASYPESGGDVHFDDDETWTKGMAPANKGVRLLWVAAHELGHSLGLRHSEESSSIMTPYYPRLQQKEVTLHEDDIKGIQSLYGDGKGDDDLCRDSSMDAIVTVKDNSTYVFKGKNYWKLTANSIAHGYPRSVDEDWVGLPSDLDTAFTWFNGKTYFFKGSKYWRSTNQVVDKGYPKEISSGFEGIPNDVDAASVLRGSNKIYFFKGSKYYKFDPERKPSVSPSYPKPISAALGGIPDDIDDALNYGNGNIYFFKGGQYWKFNERSFKVAKGGPAFPRPVGKWWFGCSSSANNDWANH